MRQLFAFLAGLFFTINIQAQQAAAQLAFEEAETLYNELQAAKLPSNQRIDQIEKVNQKLNEVEKIVGEKPKTLYLRALANNSCFEYLNEQALYTSKIAERYFTALEVSRKSAGRYMQLKQNDEVDDRYREMKKILDDMQKYPKDRKSWQKEKQAREAGIAKAEKDKEARKEFFLAGIKQYDEDKDRYYREIAPKIDAWEYKEGIKIGMDFDELKNTKKEWFKGHKTDAYGSDHRNAYKNYEKDILVDVKVDKDKKVEGYKFQIYNTKNFYKNPPRGSLQDILDDLKKYFGEHLVVERYKRTGSFYVIKSPYAKYQIIIEGDSNTACLTKTNIAHNFLYPYAFKQELLAGDTAIDPAYLDRYLGIYRSGKLSYKFGREDDIPLLVLETDNNPNTYYLLLNKEKTEFVSNYYREAPGDYGIRKMTYYNDSNSFRVKFDLEAGKAILLQDGKEHILIKDNN